MCLAESNSPGAMLRTGFWKAPRRQEQSVEDKYLQLYLLTTPQRSCIGMFPLHIGEAAAQTGWDKQQFLTVLERLVTQNEIAVSGYWVVVLNWWDHNSKPGPGLDSTIARLLAEAPPALKKNWLNAAHSASVYPSDWDGPTRTSHGDDAPDAATGSSGTRGTTRGRTPGNYNNNSKDNTNSKDNNNGNCQSQPPTLKSEFLPEQSSDSEGCGDGGSDIDYLQIAHVAQVESEHCQIFVHVSKELKLSHLESTHLSHELAARIEAGKSNPKYQIRDTERWAKVVVDSSRSSGLPILRAGVDRAKKIEADLAKEEAEKIRSDRKHEEDVAALRRTEETAFAIEIADETRLNQIVDIALSKLPIESRRKIEKTIRECVLQRKIPSGMGGAAVRQAVELLAQLPDGRGPIDGPK